MFVKNLLSPKHFLRKAHLPPRRLGSSPKTKIFGKIHAHHTKTVASFWIQICRSLALGGPVNPYLWQFFTGGAHTDINWSQDDFPAYWKLWPSVQYLCWIFPLYSPNQNTTLCDAQKPNRQKENHLLRSVPKCALPKNTINVQRLDSLSYSSEDREPLATFTAMATILWTPG